MRCRCPAGHESKEVIHLGRPEIFLGVSVSDRFLREAAEAELGLTFSAIEFPHPSPAVTM